MEPALQIPIGYKVDSFVRVDRYASKAISYRCDVCVTISQQYDSTVPLFSERFSEILRDALTTNAKSETPPLGR